MLSQQPCLKYFFCREMLGFANDSDGYLFGFNQYATPPSIKEKQNKCHCEAQEPWKLQITPNSV